ncbi:MAG: virulence RhuM family protein [Desulfobulbaceae bacterium]|nr:virulence RhuM family protein [Candidatus Kapabacteria bacterium]MBS4000581.1 virulence RhuM family protein [Desulfobulbaceae bacterium]
MEKNPSSEIIIYRTPEGTVSVDVIYNAETFWLTQKAMAELFGVGVPAVSKHIKNIFVVGELQESTTVSKMEIVVNRGFRGEVKEEIDFYNLDMIIAVGYRVNSYNATQFRIWATQTLKEYIIKGFVLDDERLKQGKKFGKDYFDELLERIREIRASERRFYQKITDIYALSVDYDKDAPITKDFFATVQNKLHWAITGETAAEIIYKNADATKLFMGLTTWKNAPQDKILKSDVTIAKNYLNEQHIRELNRIVSAFLDLAENRADRNILMKMQDWITFLVQFLELSNYPILENKGKITALEAKIKAESEYEKYRINQDKNYVSDFDKEIKRIEGKEDR